MDVEFRATSNRNEIAIASKGKKKSTKRGNGKKDKSDNGGKKVRIDLQQEKNPKELVDKGKETESDVPVAKAKRCAKSDKGKGVAIDSTEDEVSTQSQDLLEDFVTPDDEGQPGPSRLPDPPQGTKRMAEKSASKDVSAKRIKIAEIEVIVDNDKTHEEAILKSLEDWPIEDLEQRFIDCRGVIGLIREWNALSARLDILTVQKDPEVVVEGSRYRGFMSRFVIVFVMC